MKITVIGMPEQVVLASDYDALAARLASLEKVARRRLEALNASKARLAEADALLYSIWNDTEADMSWREYQNQIAEYRRKHGLTDSAAAQESDSHG